MTTLLQLLSIQTHNTILNGLTETLIRSGFYYSIGIFDMFLCVFVLSFIIIIMLLYYFCIGIYPWMTLEGHVMKRKGFTHVFTYNEF